MGFLTDIGLDILGESGVGDVNSFTESMGLGDVFEVASTKGSTPGTGLLKDWTGKALEPVMGTILKSAMMPKPLQHAPLGGSGHGVQANTASYGQVINELGKAAGGDPLQGLTGFKNLL